VRFEDGAAVVRERSGNVCECCGRRGSQTHHRQPRGMGGVHGVGKAVNSPAALVRLCGDCHAWVESHRTAAEALGLLVRRPAEPGAAPVWLRTAYGTGWWRLTPDGCYAWAHDAPELPADTPTPTGVALGLTLV
jgi:hypothetical protein